MTITNNKMEMKLSNSVQGYLICPVCNSGLQSNPSSQDLKCQNATGSHTFPLINGIPCLINESNSVFTIAGFLAHKDTFFVIEEAKPGLKSFVRKVIPTNSINTISREKYKKFAEDLLKKTSHPKVLILGGSILGHGVKELLKYPTIELIESDVSFGPRTTIILDAHNIPFKSQTFDGVIVQAVLEHVVDPYACVEEMHRVLKDDGVIYAETPFMQQVHGRQYDFTRFSHLGHRRLYRKFSLIEDGAACGPGMALSWSWMYFLNSFSDSKPIRSFLRVFGIVSSFYLKYLDYFLLKKTGALDAASSYYFMGRKSNDILSDKDLLNSYRGSF
jgi:SAM-dependent methyltransferase/uncharacterized protein YbaR (Trm112 family)